MFKIRLDRHQRILLGFGLILVLGIIFAIFLSDVPSPESPEPFFVTINDGGIEYTLKTKQRNVSDFLSEQNIILGKGDFIIPYLEWGLVPHAHIFIQRAIPITIEINNSFQKIYTQAKTISAMLEENGISLGNKDRIEISSYPNNNEREIYPEMEIKIIRVKEEIISQIISIPFQTIYQSDPNLSYKKTEISQEGKKGEKEQILKITYENGQETKRELLKEETLKPPVARIVKKGTKIEIGKTEEGIASWYDYPYFTYELPAASRTFPRGTYLRVTNLENQKSVIVKIRDFGPDPRHHPERIIDLDIYAFKKIASSKIGIIRVRVEEIL